MLFYASLSCIIIVTSSYGPIQAILGGPLNGIPLEVDSRLAYFIVTAYILALIFGFIITGFFCFHLWLLYNQYTTIEFCEKKGSDKNFKEKSPYDLGGLQNYKNVLGDNFFLWFIPVRGNLTNGGLFFDVRPELLQ